MLRAVDKWMAGYVRSVCMRPRRTKGLKHLFFCVADHYEPFRGGVSRQAARRSVHDWLETYKRSVEGIRDADGRGPRHTFFYPAEDYDFEIMESLAALCRSGRGEVEIHLHHRNDSKEALAEKLLAFKDHLSDRHGLLGRDAAGRPRYGFVHGNWALCNSRPDGDWCGVNEELGILADTGCYADFTFPSAPSPTQPRMVNSLYRAWDRAGRPRGADWGVPVESTCGAEAGATNDACRPGVSRAGVRGHAAEERPGGLMIIQGPLALDWSRRKWGILPRLENAEISAANPPRAERMRLWVRQWVHVRGQPDWVFVKVHTHGCVPDTARMLLGETMRHAHEILGRLFNDGSQWRLHYVTAREMYNLVLAAEAGRAGDPGDWIDSVIGPPAIAAGAMAGQAGSATSPGCTRLLSPA
jgi:hypothetical protein